ncbi:hypothetical protein D3H65_04195 [Paraflavitalea soli]|uniref:Uncharacterized protein n=1 Tax=Paraflavitalea soli TaxID=2315862 RepID=A0A3B7MIU2_9BACT|nr:hypothetical protein [Paraflavitalea soli]AXY73223.1 hypothetical protein D3H65_04195 [Paraflavitalea soli]
MDQFFHIRMLMSIIVSLSVATLLKGVAKLIEHPTKVRLYWVHLAWVGFIFLSLLDFWWWEILLKKVSAWSFGSYVFIICFVVVYYIICSLLFPDDMKEYDGYKGYFYSRKAWFFSFLGVSFLFDVCDTLLKGVDHYHALGTEYIIRIAIHVLLCLLAIRSRNERFHAALVIFFILYNLFWVIRKYQVL